MSLIITDKNSWIEIAWSQVKIGYFTINRMWFFEETGLPRFSANLYLEYSKDGEIYKRNPISIDNLSEGDFSLKTLYKAMKDLPEFAEAKDSIPTYIPPVKIEETVVENTEESISEEIQAEEIVSEESSIPTEEVVDPLSE